MIIFFTIAAVSLLLAGCSPKMYPVQRDTVTRVRTEIVERLVRDTVEVALPQEGRQVLTRDTSSTLEIAAAVSVAAVTDGLLYHSLETNPGYKPRVEVVWKDRVEYRDTTIYVADTRVVEVEKPPGGWQRTVMALGYVMLGVLAFAVIIGILKWRKIL